MHPHAFAVLSMSSLSPIPTNLVLRRQCRYQLASSIRNKHNNIPISIAKAKPINMNTSSLIQKSFGAKKGTQRKIL